MKDETKGADYKANVDIEFIDAYKGVKTVRLLELIHFSKLK
jgi:hypothetical protein